MNVWSLKVVTALLAFLGSGCSHARTAGEAQPPREDRTGDQAEYDTSGLDIFWRTVDILEADRSPSEAEWSRLLEHPGYVVIESKGGRAAPLRECMPVVFRPSARVRLAATIEAGDSRTRRICRHLDEVRDQRAELERFESELQAGDELDRAIRMAARYLPPGSTGGESPHAYVILFETNGFGGTSLALDAKMLHDMTTEQRREYLAHEFHHVYVNGLDDTAIAGDDPDSAESDLAGALSGLAEEGIASMLDKREWLDPSYADTLAPLWKEVTGSFRGLYAQSGDVLAGIDTTLRDVAAGTTTRTEAADSIRNALPWGGHPTGMYMALAIEAAEGPTRLAGLAADPVGFVLAYQDAATGDASLYQLSEEALSVLRNTSR